MKNIHTNEHFGEATCFGKKTESLNPLKTKRRLLYLKTQFEPRKMLYLKTQFVPRRLLYLKTHFVQRRLLY